MKTYLQPFPALDNLMTRYYELTQTQTIPNIVRYAFAWRVLAEDFEMDKRVAMSEMCHARARFYGRQAGGEYIRLIDMPFSELIAVTRTAESEDA